jgi:N-acetyl-anhydromuramyl-L-alanine amidase AmpD
MFTILKRGSTGENVRLLQSFLKIKVDGDFGPTTERTVKSWQKAKGLLDDGIVGPKTWAAMGLKDLSLSTDQSETIAKTNDNLIIKKSYLPADEYMAGPTKKEYLFLHHTAGWNNPYNVITAWDRDTRGRVGTQYVIGGPNPVTGDTRYDGEVVECFGDLAYAGHLGAVNSHYMHKHSVGIEICNFGQLTPSGSGYKTYTGQLVQEDQVCDLGYEFRGFRYWHAYSPAQISALKKLIRHICKLHNIDTKAGLVTMFDKFDEPDEAFEYMKDASDGKIKGILSHTNVRKDKFDIYPSPELIAALRNL